MKILYGIQGTGNGHITRARHMAKALAGHEDIQVDYFFSGRERANFFDMEIFEEYSNKRGLTFITENGRIKHLQTALKNNFFSLVSDIKSTNLTQYDLVLNDFEPVTAWAAKTQGVPSLSVSHQAAFLSHVPKKNQTFVDKVITQYFAPTQYNLGTHWYHFGHNIIPPFVSKELLDYATKPRASNNKILVYLPFESLSAVQEQLEVLSEWQFICYHPYITQAHNIRNISFQPLSTQLFKKDLLVCSGVISNCGFELSTECLSLGKPLLVKPLHKQYEQISNAYTLQKLGLCEVIDSINAEQIDDWLQTKEGTQVSYPTDCNDLIDWIKQGKWQSSQEICQSLWKQVIFPHGVKDKLDKLIHTNI